MMFATRSGPAARLIYVRAVSPAEANVVFLQSLAAARPIGDRLYRSIDGGLSFSEVLVTTDPTAVSGGHGRARRLRGAVAVGLGATRRHAGGLRERPGYRRRLARRCRRTRPALGLLRRRRCVRRAADRALHASPYQCCDHMQRICICARVNRVQAVTFVRVISFAWRSRDVYPPGYKAVCIRSSTNAR
jgi:hypothetical protein